MIVNIKMQGEKLVNTLRKTSKMQLMEWKHSMDIDELILKVVRDSKGDQREASKILNLSESTLSRWIHELELTAKINVIKKGNNLPPTTRFLNMKNPDGLKIIENAISSNCLDCDATYADAMYNSINGIIKRSGDLVVVVKDHMNIKHRFTLDRESV